MCFVLKNIGGLSHLRHLLTNGSFLSTPKDYCLKLCYLTGSQPTDSWWRSAVCPRDSGTAEPGSESPA